MGLSTVALFLCGSGLHPYAFPVRREVLSEGYPKPQELWYQQKLDHFNASDQRRWSHRYLMNNDTWDGRGHLANGCPGPILLYTGNEGPVTAFWELSGFIVAELAPKLGGLLLFPEERHYGKSLPFGNNSLSTEHLHYLTTAQVLEDFVDIVAHVKATIPLASNCPVVAFGGSYGGTLTALLRATHPETVIGGLAASSEIGYYDLAGWDKHGVDEFTFENVVINTWDRARPGCLDVVRSTLRAIDEANESYIVKTFNACDAHALGPGPKSSFFAYVLEGMPQGDYPSLGFPVTKACDALLDAQTGSADANVHTRLIEAAAGIAKTFYDSASCVPYSVGGPGNTPGDGPAKSAWGYQSCTETLHAFSARVLRNYTFERRASCKLCGELYNGAVRPDLSALARKFGGAYPMAEGSAGVSHLIWSQGTLDPWHGWFKNIAAPPQHLEIYHFLMEGSAHHTDLRLPSSADPKSVVRTRHLEEQIIRKWIAESVEQVVVL
jgi:pimeloyl-ACP methyl ester carboxylesterase